MNKLTNKESYNSFKQINYEILTLDMLSKLLEVLRENYLFYDSEENSYFWNTGINEFNSDLEEFENFAEDKLKHFQDCEKIIERLKNE